MLLTAAGLLTLERLCYIWIARAPAAFRAWCARPLIRRLGEPTEIVEYLFLSFKGIQAAVFLSWCYVFGAGSLRPVTEDFAWLSLGIALVLAGQVLTSLVFYRLGRVGVFYGNQLGYTLPWCDAFPFGTLQHPQYVGALLSIWGFFLIMRFPEPDWYVLPVIETIYYAIGAHLEG